MEPESEVTPERHAKQAKPLAELHLAEPDVLNTLLMRYDLWRNQDSSPVRDISNKTYTQSPVYLFNVLVALEWEPTYQERQELVEAFRNAAEFLYNVTDSCMAFGQVVIGGQELMDCADIQIMASNRFNPRSWVDGLRNPIKYTPIRVGRGIWDKNERRTLGWNEKQSFRTLIHEWAHYALGLKDEYLEARPVIPQILRDANHPSKHLLVDRSASDQVSARNSHTVVIPKIGVPNGSLMQSIGDELVPLEARNKAERYQQIWAQIKERYPDVQPSGTIDLVERELPLELAVFFLEKGHDGPQLTFEPWSAQLLLMAPEGIIDEHCWIYVVKGDITANPEQIIAQGTFDAPSATAGFKLLNARVDDWLVLMGNDEDGKQVVLQGKIVGTEPLRKHGSHKAIVEWTKITPKAFPMVDVIPLPCGSDAVTSTIQVRVDGAQPVAAWIFPLGQPLANPRLEPDTTNRATWISQECHTASLDGHVLLRWNDGSMSICTFSQGGGPATHVAARYSPITAGSAEGNVMIFFKDDKQSTSNTRVVTTLLHGSFGATPDSAEPRSYVFSLTSNGLLPDTLNPTLVMYFDSKAPQAGGDLVIHRLQEGAWRPMQTYVHSTKDSSFAAMPMNKDTAANLLGVGDGSLIERYRIFWLPHGSSKASETR